MEFEKLTGKPMLLDLKVVMRKVKAGLILIVTVFTALIFLSGRGLKWWQGIPFAYSVCLCTINTGGWCSMAKALEKLSQLIMVQLKQVSNNKISFFLQHLEVTTGLCVRLGHGCANQDTEGKRFKFPIHCWDVTKPPYLFSGELCTSPLHSELLCVSIVCCRRIGQCFSVLRTRKSDVILT